MKKIKGVYRSKTARNSLVYTVDFVLQIVVLTFYVLLISRKLGPSSYGALASIGAISIIGSVFSGWGCDQILITNVSVAKEDFKKFFGSGLKMIVTTYPILLTVLLLVLYFLIPSSQVSVLSLILFISSELIFTKLIFFSKSCFVVFERAKDQLIINIFTAIIKLIFLVFAITFTDNFTLNNWSVWYAVSLFIASFFSITYVIYHLGKPIFGKVKTGFVLGMQFCIEQASLATLKDVDKPIVVAILGTEQGGYYAAAFKLVDAASAPVRGVLYAVYIKYFEFGNKEKKDGITYAIKLLPFLITGTLVVCCFLYFFAWLMPTILGTDYSPAVSLVQILFLYPLFLGLLGTGIDLLRGIGMQLTRTYIMIFSSILSVPTSYVFILMFNIKGVAYAKIFIIFLTVTIVWLFIYKVNNLERKHE